jgi:hypothetical protein
MSAPAQTPAAFNPRQPFSRAEARAAGLTAEMLLGRRFHKICWDTYVAREVPITPLLRAAAIIRLVPSGSYISHHTAAELWGAAPPANGATHVTNPAPPAARACRPSRALWQPDHSGTRRLMAQASLRYVGSVLRRQTRLRPPRRRRGVSLFWCLRLFVPASGAGLGTTERGFSASWPVMG